MDNYIGKRLEGRYEIREIIGVGGMANVYKAFDVVDEKMVAVKILRDEFAENEDFIKRFKTESKAISVLAHPNIVKVYDVTFTDRIQSIVMEFVDGITLKEYIDQQGVLKWKDAVHFSVQILRALQHAHDKGIVHRDIKPQNIMLQQDGTIKVMDFGIARFNRSESFTQTDKVIGSVHYISPEQARGDITDEKTDIYSVGVMLFEMLTGKLPFEAADPVSVALKQIADKPQMPREINPSIPEGLEDITIRAMQKDVALRYQTASEMLRDIDEFKKNPHIQFEYKYFVNESPTIFINKINQPKGKTEETFEEEVPEKKKSPTMLILAGVASVLVVLAVVICIFMFSNMMKDSNTDIEVPNLIGMNYEEAKRLYPDIKFEESKKYSSEHEKNTIIEQDPPSNGRKMKSNGTLKIVLSDGPREEEIPDIYNKTVEVAKGMLERAGFDPNKIITEPNKENKPGIGDGVVTDCDPAIGTKAPVDKTITIYYNPAKEPINVPNVIGMDQEEAKITLEGVKFIVKITSKDSGEPAGRVIDQNPKDKALPFETIEIFVSNGNAPANEMKIDIKLPSNVKTLTTFTASIDGVVVPSGTLKCYPNDKKIWSLSLSGKGTKTLKVRIGDEDFLYQEIKIDFDAKTQQVIKTNKYPPNDNSNITSVPSEPSSGSSSDISDDLSQGTSEGN